MQPDVTAVASLLAKAGVENATVDTVPVLGVVVRVDPTALRAAILALKTSDAAFDFMVDLFGIDTGEAIDVVVHLRSFSRDEDIYLKSEHAYDSIHHSIWDVFPAALMPEREMCELFGMKLANHPNPKRLLTTDGVPPYLRKSTLIRTAKEVRDR